MSDCEDQCSPSPAKKERRAKGKRQTGNQVRHGFHLKPYNVYLFYRENSAQTLQPKP